MSPTTMKSIKRIIPNILEELETLTEICCVIPATIDEKMRIEIPFAIPFSVISSPNRMRRSAQTVIENPDNKSVPKLVSITALPKR